MRGGLEWTLLLSEIGSPAASLPEKLLGANFFGNNYSSKYNTEEESLRRNFFLMDHEIGHQWLIYIGRDEGISDGMHYSKWLNNGFQRDGNWWGDVMGGSSWKQNSDGTFSINDLVHQGFSKLSLYLMGLAPVTEVSDIQLVVPNDPNTQDLHNVQGSLKTIKINDLITKYGIRIPNYTSSQKNFRMGYILVVKKGETGYQADLNVLNWIAKDFPSEWSLVTYGRSTINK